MRVRIAPSLLAADFARLADALARAEEGGADLVHVDVMDGRFVPNLTIGPPVVAALRKATGLPLDVHLMIERPEQQIAEFAKAGADSISIHAEATPHINRTLSAIRDLGCLAGLAINPGTPVEAARELRGYADILLCMTVNPGWGGQPFIPESPDKVARLKSLAGEAVIEADGGVDAETVPAVAAAGASLFVAGSAVFGTGDPAAAYTAIAAAADAV